MSLTSLFLFEKRKTKRKNYEKEKGKEGTEEIGREEDYDEVLWSGPCARSHPLLTLPLLYHFSCVLSVKRKQKKGKGSERGETTRRPF